MDELVLCIPRHALVERLGEWRGVARHDRSVLAELIATHGSFLPRAIAEPDPTWKQVIPYLVLRDGDRVFLMQRTRGGTDARLHERYSIGIGGHLSTADGDLETGLAREWREEIDAAFVPAFEYRGLLNDDSDAVGQVHVGAVFTADAAGRAVAVRETAKLTGRFAPGDEVAAVADRLETWSALVFDDLATRIIGREGT